MNMDERVIDFQKMSTIQNYALANHFMESCLFDKKLAMNSYLDWREINLIENGLRNPVCSARDVPLKSMDVNVRLNHVYASVAVRQVYVNDGEGAKEFTFQFNLLESTLVSFNAEINGEVVVCECREREEALDEYSDAIAEGNVAFVVEKGDVHPGIFVVSIGNLKPGELCIVNLEYLTLVTADDFEYELDLPFTYDVAFLDIGGGLNINVEMQFQESIESIICLSHKYASNIEGNTATLRVEEDLSGFPFKMRVRCVEDSFETLSCIIEKDDSIDEQYDVVSLFLHPKFDVPSASSEVIFIIDRSGSMSGTRIQQAANSLQIALRSLPEMTKFNFVGFGSRSTALFDESVYLDEGTFKLASNYISSLKADMGGTNILDPLMNCVEANLDPVFPRTIFLLTDGDVPNSGEILEYVKNNTNSVKIFTFGIGAQASKTIVSGIAMYGKGKAEYILDGQRIERVIMKQLNYALQPAIKDIEIEWGGLPAVEKPFQNKIEEISYGGCLRYFAFVEKRANYNHEIVLKGLIESKPIEYRINLSEDNTSENIVFHKLLAAEYIKKMERNVQHKDTIIQLGLKWNLVSKHTSYVCSIQSSDESNLTSMKHVSLNQMIVPPKNTNKLQVGSNKSRRRNAKIAKTQATTQAQPPSRQRQTQFILVDGKQYQVSNMTHSKTGKHGHAKSHIVAFDIVTGKKIDMVLPQNELHLTDTVSQPPLGSIGKNENSRDKISQGFQGNQNNPQLTSTVSQKPLESIGKNENIRDIDKLIYLQGFQGNFVLSDTFLSFVGLQQDDILANIPATISESFLNSSAIWTTIIGIYLYETKFTDDKDEWILLFTKAVKWLKSNFDTTTIPFDLPSLYEQVEQLKFPSYN